MSTDSALPSVASARQTRRRKPMSLAGHLVEIRKRLMRAAAAILVGTVVGWILSDWVLAAMRTPITEVARMQNRIAELNYDTITSAFDLRMQIAITVGIVISSPVWLYQIWAFFIPGLTRKELRYGMGFFVSAVVLFFVGAASGWLLVPHIVTLLTGFAPASTSAFIQASTYFTFLLKLVIAVGIAFVLPVFLVLLNFIGVMSGHAILKAWRVAILLIVVFCAFATPSADVLSMFLLAIPMVGLYFIAVGIAVAHDRRQLRKSTLALDSVS